MKKVIISAITLGLTLIAFSSYAAWSFSASPQLENKNVPEMLARVMPAVVNVSAQGSLPPNVLIQNNASGRAQPRHFESMGSGVIVDAKNAYVLTNAHLLRATQSVTVTLSDGRILKAKLVGTDPASDIAVLKIDAQHLTAIPLGNSDQLKVGQFVAAIGNPFGLNQTVTSGIISALQRTGLGIEGYENFIQTDAPINPGNSGGALINLKGELLGINTAILSSGSNMGNIGIGFAIPINMANAVMQQLIKYGSVRRGLIGVLIQDLTPALTSAFNLPANATGALISQVSAYSPAQSAGLHVGDVIKKIDNQTIVNASQVKNTVGMLRVGEQIDVTLLRDGHEKKVSLTITDSQRYTKMAEKSNPFLYGMALRNFDQTISGYDHLVGVQVADIDENSTAWYAGIRLGDVILSANHTLIPNVEKLKEIANKTKNQLLINLLSPRTGARFVVIKQ